MILLAADFESGCNVSIFLFFFVGEGMVGQWVVKSKKINMLSLL